MSLSPTLCYGAGAQRGPAGARTASGIALPLLAGLSLFEIPTESTRILGMLRRGLGSTAPLPPRGREGAQAEAGGLAPRAQVHAAGLPVPPAAAADGGGRVLPAGTVPGLGRSLPALPMGSGSTADGCRSPGAKTGPGQARQGCEVQMRKAGVRETPSSNEQVFWDQCIQSPALTGPRAWGTDARLGPRGVKRPGRWGEDEMHGDAQRAAFINRHTSSGSWRLFSLLFLFISLTLRLLEA